MDVENVVYEVPYMDNVAKIYQEGPYGLWKIKLARGQTPGAFSGDFTSPNVAQLLIKTYEYNKKHKVV